MLKRISQLAVFSACVLAASLASAQTKSTLTIYSYESFVGLYGPGKPVAEAFEKICNCKLTYVVAEDGGALLSKLKLEGASTKADLVLGLDTNLIGEAVASGLFARHGISIDHLSPSKLALPQPWIDPIFVPFDWSYFAFVYDAEKLKDVPGSLKQLVEEKSGPRIIIEDPRTSTPGLGLLVWMKTVYGDKAAEAWSQLKPRIVTVTKGWSEAYGLFLKGEADMVLSYSTSPAYHIGVEKRVKYQAAMFSEGHALQIEVAGLVASSKQPELGRRFLTFLLTDEVQALLPETNWMYPAKMPEGGLPVSFKTLPIPAKALLVDPAIVAAKRRAWVEEWLAAIAQ